MSPKDFISDVQALVSQNKLADARHLLEEALAANPDLYLYQEVLGDVALAEGNMTAARAAYQRALGLAPFARWIETKLSDMGAPKVSKVFTGLYQRYPDMTQRRQAEGGRRLAGHMAQGTPQAPLVSIVTAVYDNDDTLQRCIDSVRAQTYANIEHIVVDGGSPESTLAVLRANEEILDYYVSEPDKGIYSAMNKGIRLAQGEYICLLNSDDRYDPDFVRHCVEVALAHAPENRPDIVYSDFYDGEAHLPAQPFADGILFGNLNINHCTFLVNRACYDRIGPYDEVLKIVSDMVWMRKAYRMGERFELLSTPYFRFSHGGASSGNSPTRRQQIISENGTCYRNDFPFLTQEEAEALYLMRFNDAKLETALDVYRRHAGDNDLFRSALAGYVAHCFRDRGSYKLAYDQEERFKKYWAIASEMGIDQKNIRFATSQGCISEVLSSIAAIPLKPGSPSGRRILHYVTVFSAPPETFIYDLLNRLETSTDHDNIVLYQHGELRTERPFEKAVHLPWEKLRKSVGQAIYEYLVKTLKIDLIVAHFAINEHRLSERTAELDIVRPTIVMTHGIDVFKMKTPSEYTSYVLDDLAAREDVCFTAVSDYLKRELVEAGVPPAKITTLPNSVNGRFFEHRKTDGFYTRDAQRDLQLLSIGRLIDWKGHRFLLSALARFRKECTKNVKLTIVYGKDETLLETLQKQVADLGMRENVVFEPFIDLSKRPEYLAQFDLFVHPSTYTDDAVQKSETFGVAVLEAISAGLPVITTDAGGLPEVIGGATPFARIVKNGSAGALFKALSDMYRDPATFSDNIAYARDRLDAFSGDKQIKGFEALIQNTARPLNVALFSSSTLQGAGYAAYRLHRGLTDLQGVRSKIFTTVRAHEKEPGVAFVRHPSGNGNAWRALQNPPKPGHTIYSVNQTHIPSNALLEMVEPYDVINLHWHARFLSAENIAALTHSNKPVVMTVRDMQPITGGCHFFHGCDGWQRDCANCPQIPSAYSNYPASLLAAKRAHYNFENLTMVTLSNHTRGILEKTPYFKDCRIETIPNSIETDVFKPYDRFKRRAEFGLPSERKIIGYVPSFSSEVKGYREFIQALDLLNPKELGFDPFIMLVGPETPATIAIKQDKQSVGYITDNAKLARAYSCADLIVVPSLEETFSNTAAEAISCGVPVVGFRTGAIPDLAVNGKTGFTCEVGDVPELARGIKEVLQAPSMQDACREHALDMLPFMKQAHSYEALYRDLLKGSRNGTSREGRVIDSFDHTSMGLANIATEIVNGGVKVSQRAAQNVATLGLG